VALQVAVFVRAEVEESNARPSFTPLSQGHICEAMLAASFARLSCQGRRRSVGDSCVSLSLCWEQRCWKALPGRPSPPSPKVISVRPCWLPRLRVCRVGDVDGWWVMATCSCRCAGSKGDGKRCQAVLYLPTWQLAKDLEHNIDAVRKFHTANPTKPGPPD
jgi:hypothetical protein